MSMYLFLSEGHRRENKQKKKPTVECLENMPHADVTLHIGLDEDYFEESRVTEMTVRATVGENVHHLSLLFFILNSSIKKKPVLKNCIR